MPNWIENGVKISHKDEKKMDWLTNKVIHTENDEEVFDFDRIIEMPKELEGITSPVRPVKTKKEADEINKKSEYPSRGRVITELEQKKLKNQYGADNWYDWQYTNWGVKWGASDLKIVEKDKNWIDIEFNTPWAPPDKIWESLALRGFQIHGVWQDEDPSSNGYTDYGDDNDSDWYINSTVERY